MEHRWGERIAVRGTVELSCGSSPPVRGWLENVSSSGAFVRTQGRGPPRGPVEVILQGGSFRRYSVQLPAYVVRETATGVGIEWCEFAPRPIREVMIRGRRANGDRAGIDRAGGERPGARAQRSSGHSAREPNTAMQPWAQSGAEPAAIGTNTLPVA